MPELPEVESAAAALRAAAVGRRIARAHLLHPALGRRLGAEQAARLEGRAIRDVVRRGKHQLIALDDGATLVAHFRMTGDWVVGRIADPPERFARAVLELDDGTRVTLDDPRALATLVLVPAGTDALPALGMEPLDAGFTPVALRAALARRRGPIKPVLLDQRVVAGLGNIYAAEALWLARISPRARAGTLSAARVARLVRAVRGVLRRASAGRYWAGGGGARWRVYDRAGRACPRCGAAIRRIVQAGRSTYYCPRCQRR